jgi:hypothetical protein
MSADNGYFELCDRNVRGWIEQESVHLAAGDGKDPVEMTNSEVLALISNLQKLVTRIDN